MLSDDAENDDEDEDVILPTNQQMYSNYLQQAEQCVEYKRNMKKNNDYICHQAVHNSLAKKFIYIKVMNN